ncbi:MAG TPA: PAS domain-containing sensor histidine kinase, partial [Chitinophagaceae bacterium]|nr:PAS domain-containing sensor histidine kinase [Chitinophagaceae bacterium]
MLSVKSYEALQAEFEKLQLQLQEANETIEAIRSGEVDALVVSNGQEHQLYTLKSADQTYRVFIEKMKEGAVTLNREGLILYSNSQFATMVDMPLAKVIGLPITDFIPDKFQRAFQEIFEEGWESDSKGEISLINKNNQLIPFLLSVTSLELDDGSALSIILTDMTAQKENELQLKSKNEQLEQARLVVAKMNEELEDIVRIRTKDLFVSREHFKFLADNIPVIVWTTDGNGQADYFNKKWYEYTGLDFERSRGFGSQQVLHPDDLIQTAKAWTEAITNQTSFQFEYRIKRASDGQYRWHLGKGEPFKDETGNLIAWFGTSTDIEDQKKEIEKKDEFIGVASHELKTPLTSLKGYVQLIGQTELPEPVKLYIEKANSSLNKLQHLINDLLDVSKIKAGRLKFDTTIFDLSELIKQCIENCRYIYPSHKLTEELEQNIVINGNEERLEQVLMNLINNAVKYSNG